MLLRDVEGRVYYCSTAQEIVQMGRAARAVVVTTNTLVTLIVMKARVAAQTVFVMEAVTYEPGT